MAGRKNTGEVRREAGHFLLENTQPFRGFLLKPDMDTGHLLLEGKSSADFFKRRIREIHRS
ncbi:MAG: hypothetical protein LBT13_02150 [Treponema sp.]|nr:hypothetical protein [Treponema sp.]